MKRVIEGGTVVNDGKTFNGTIVIDNDIIEAVISDGNYAGADTGACEHIDATGCYVLPGVIDSHVHFREPGLTEKATIHTESMAAAAGGVTSFFDMPNTIPQTTTLEALEEKFSIAAASSHVNYSFFFGATNDNASLFSRLDTHRIPGIKLFMGSSTGNMLVDKAAALGKIFGESPLPLMAHCEDTDIIKRNTAKAVAMYGDDPRVTHHPEIRSSEACYRSTELAVSLARRYGQQLHVAHVSTERELELFSPHEPLITAEATVSHLYFCDRDYNALGTRIKCNPAIKSTRDRDALQSALTDGRIATIGTDHAPHLLSQKEGGCLRAASGMPMVQFSLVTMLELADRGVLTIERLVELMCHRPALLFSVRQRGFLRKGYKADITIVRPETWTLTGSHILSKCGWSPMEGHTFMWRVEHTLCNGHTVYDGKKVDEKYIAQEINFR